MENSIRSFYDLVIEIISMNLVLLSIVVSLKIHEVKQVFNVVKRGLNQRIN